MRSPLVELPLITSLIKDHKHIILKHLQQLLPDLNEFKPQSFLTITGVNIIA